MTTPLLYAIAGPNGAGKSTYVEEILGPLTHLPFINADLLAREHWPEDPAAHAYDAAAVAAGEREAAIARRQSFITETVFSHRSKLELVNAARQAGYLVHLHVILVPLQLAVARVAIRAELGGHDVPEVKIRQRYHRLWRLVRAGIEHVDEVVILDNSRAARPFRPVARFRRGLAVAPPSWPEWTPRDLRTD